MPRGFCEGVAQVEGQASTCAERLAHAEAMVRQFAKYRAADSIGVSEDYADRSQTVGVVVPCFNQGRFLEECVRSLERQTIARWTAVIIDDASTDGTSAQLAERLASNRIQARVLRGNVGVCRVREIGFGMLSGCGYVIGVDADDVLEPAYLEKLLVVLRRDPRCGGAYGTQHAFGESSSKPAGWTWPMGPIDMSRRFDENFVPASGLLLRSAAIRTIWGWRRELSGNLEEWDYWLQLVDAGWRLAWVPEAVYHYRRHALAATASWTRTRSALVDSSLLRYHRAGIAREIGVAPFLRRRVIPELRGALREGRMRDAMHIGARALRAAPVATTRLLVESYWEAWRARRSSRMAARRSRNG